MFLFVSYYCLFSEHILGLASPTPVRFTALLCNAAFPSLVGEDVKISKIKTNSLGILLLKKLQ